MKTNYLRVSIIKYVAMWSPMKGINSGAVTTVDIEVVFNRTLCIIGSDEFDLHDLFSHELAPIPISLFLDDIHTFIHFKPRGFYDTSVLQDIA